MNKRPDPKLPLRAVACVMTPVPTSHEYRMRYVMMGREPPPSKAPTALCLYFEGFGMRRVYRRRNYNDKPESFNGKHVVKLNRKWVAVDIETMALEVKANA